MNIAHVREFLNLAETLNFSETAYQTDVSTSALSRHMHLLEEELGCRLFDRTTRQISLSDFGKIYLPFAVKLVRDYENGMHAAAGYRMRQSRTFLCGAISTLEEYHITAQLIKFRRQYPDYKANMVIGTIADLESRFMSRALNVYTAVRNPAIPDLIFSKFGESKIRAIVREGDVPAGQTSVSLAMLADKPLLLPERGTIFYKKIMKYYEQNGISPTVLYTGGYPESVPLIQEGMGVALYPFETGRSVSGEGLRVLETDPEIIYEYGLGYRKDLTPAERLFVEFQKQFAMA